MDESTYARVNAQLIVVNVLFWHWQIPTNELADLCSMKGCKIEKEISDENIKCMIEV
jgi:hypothetical protein